MAIAGDAIHEELEAAHVRGEMQIAEQAATYDGFMGLTKWGSLAIAVAVVFLTLWFCTPLGFMGGLGAGLGLTILGVVFLRNKPQPH